MYLIKEEATQNQKLPASGVNRRNLIRSHSYIQLKTTGNINLRFKACKIP
jgi:hypothetical protein